MSRWLLHTASVQVARSIDREHGVVSTRHGLCMLGQGRKGADSDVLVSPDLISAALLPVLGVRRNLMLMRSAQRVRNGAL